MFEDLIDTIKANPWRAAAIALFLIVGIHAIIKDDARCVAENGQAYCDHLDDEMDGTL